MSFCLAAVQSSRPITIGIRYQDCIGVCKAARRSFADLPFQHVHQAFLLSLLSSTYIHLTYAILPLIHENVSLV